MTKRWFEPQGDLPATPATIQADLVTMRERLERSLGTELEVTLAMQEEIVESKTTDLQQWRSDAERTMSPEIRAELAARRARNDAEFERECQAASERRPEELKRRISRLRTESLARQAAALKAAQRAKV